LKYKKKSDLNNHKSVNQVKIYLQTNDDNLRCINDLLVEKRFAVYLSDLQTKHDQASNFYEIDEDRSVFSSFNDYNNNDTSGLCKQNLNRETSASSSLNLCDNEEHYDLKHIKSYLNNKVQGTTRMQKNVENIHKSDSPERPLNIRSSIQDTYEKRMKILEMDESSPTTSSP
jgi:hypothetical protein